MESGQNRIFEDFFTLFGLNFGKLSPTANQVTSLLTFLKPLYWTWSMYKEFLTDIAYLMRTRLMINFTVVERTVPAKSPGHVRHVHVCSWMPASPLSIKFIAE